MRPALVLCSHGTSDPRGQEVVRRLAAVVRRSTTAAVHEAVVDVEEHQLPAVLSRVRGPAVVVPLLLSTGYHVLNDIAAAVADRPGTVAAAALGPDWSLAEVGVQHLRSVGARREDVVVLGGSGSSQAGAMADVDGAAERLGALWGGQVRVGHLGHCGTPVAEVVAQVRDVHPGVRVVVSSYLLAPGYFQDRLEACGADVVTGPLIDPSPDRALVELVLHRYAATLTSAP